MHLVASTNDASLQKDTWRIYYFNAIIPIHVQTVGVVQIKEWAPPERNRISLWFVLRISASDTICPVGMN